MTNGKLLAAAIGALAIQASLPAAADGNDCCFRLTPYYWAVGIDGSLEDNRGATTSQVDFSNDIADVSDNLEYNGSLQLEHHLGHWVNFAAVDYMKVDNDNSDINIAGADVKMETKGTLATAATGYRFEMGERSQVDLMVGVRYAKLDVQASLNGGPGGSISGDTDLTDGIVMLRPRFAITRYWSFSPTMAIGGGDSDKVYELAPELVWTNDCCNLEVRFGYRKVAYEYEENNVKLDFSFAGPMIGVGFAF